MSENTGEYREQYKMAIDFLKFEATTLWQIFNAFFIGNNIFFVLISALYTKREEKDTPLLFLLAGIIGLLIAFLWLMAFRRNSHWYNYRMKQAKKAEANYVKEIKDEKWYLLNQDAKEFADGNEIKGLKNNHLAYVMIVTFVLIYAAIILWSLFNILCKP